MHEWRVTSCLDELWMELETIEDRVLTEWKACPSKRTKFSKTLMTLMYSLYNRRGNEYIALKSALRVARLSSCKTAWRLCALKFTPNEVKVTLVSDDGRYSEYYHETVSFHEPGKYAFNTFGLSLLPPLKEYMEYEGECSSSCHDLFSETSSSDSELSKKD